jgi:hypothetical protein
MMKSPLTSKAERKAEALAEAMKHAKPPWIRFLAAIPFWLIPATVQLTVAAPLAALAALALGFPILKTVAALALALAIKYAAVDPWDGMVKRFVERRLTMAAVNAARRTIKHAAASGMAPDDLADLANDLGKALAEATNGDLEMDSIIIDPNNPDDLAKYEAMKKKHSRPGRTSEEIKLEYERTTREADRKAKTRGGDIWRSQ